MSISPNIVIMTKAELLDYRDEWFDKGVQRGRFEERCDQSQAKADVEAVTGQTSEVTEESVSRPVDGRSSTATSERMDVTGGESAALNSKAVAETDANAPGDTGLVSGVSSAPNHQPHAVSQGWRTDLENAPRDGTRFLACATEPGWGATRIVRFAHPYDRLPLDDGRNMWPSAPTHWMPLPAPPSPYSVEER